MQFYLKWHLFSCNSHHRKEITSYKTAQKFLKKYLLVKQMKEFNFNVNQKKTG